MKIVSWNINGYRSITGQNPSRRYDKVTNDNKLFEYIEKYSPDIICLQETKANLDQIKEDLKYPPGYQGFYHSCRRKKGYSGVATFYKEEPIKNNFDIGIEKFDNEGRIIETIFKNFKIYNIYFPKGYADSERLDFKLEFYDALFSYIEKNRKKDDKIIISGDYNTAHKEIDLARAKENVGTSGFMPIEREKLDWIASLGYQDAFRLLNDETGHYSWWSQRGRARENNVGWRIDYHFITNNLKPKLKTALQQPLEYGSDHCPVVIELEI